MHCGRYTGIPGTAIIVLAPFCDTARAALDWSDGRGTLFQHSSRTGGSVARGGRREPAAGAQAARGFQSVTPF